MATYENKVDRTRLAIQMFMVLAGAWWYLYWILQPIHAGKAWLNNINRHTNWRFLGAKGSTFFLQAIPISVIAGLAYIVIELRRRRRLRTGRSRRSEKPKVNIWTLPIILRSPLGMLTMADLVFILAILFVVFFYLIKSSLADSRLIDNSPTFPGAPPKWQEKLEKAGERFGIAAMIPFALLWLPVARGSPVLRLTGVPFERAVKYHMWLGLLTIWLLVAHGSCLIAFFALIHKPSTLLEWPKMGVGIIPGWIALAAGCLMLVTAFGRVRRKNFDMFFATHHLYLVFLLFVGFHRPNVMYLYVVPVLLFFLDRLMRMVQSRKRVDVLSARVLPSGVMELKFAKPACLEYDPLSFLYVLFPSVSRFEWHPFSVASSPLDGTNQIAIYIKPLGRYTRDLHSLLISSSQLDKAGHLACPFAFKLSLEGPYGEESCFYLKYKTLILVAGGIGITPFLAIVRDIMHRHRLQEEDLPTDIQLIYCVRTPNEMFILETLNLNKLCPNYGERLNVVSRPFVTSKVQPQNYLTVEQVESSASSYEDFTCIDVKEPVAEILGKPISEAKPMSAIHATGESGWVAATILSAMVGFFILWGLFQVTIIDDDFPTYFVVLLFFTCIFLAVTVFGGGVMLIWSFNLKRKSSEADNKVASKRSSTASPDTEVVSTRPGIEDADSDTQGASVWLGNVTYGKRPDMKELFKQIAKQYEGGNVGVLVSGSLNLQEDVARECKHHSLSKDSNVALHYHSVSFEL